MFFAHRCTAAAALALALFAPAAHPQNAIGKLRMGAAWYPEQWPESRWDADLALMEAAHLNVVRVGEFAWSTMEPSEGQFEFGWLDRAVALAAKHGIDVVLGTPTAAPPAWLTTKYPDTLRVGENGQRDEHGNREQFSYTSPRYRTFATRIAHEMAARYGHNPHVLGWQIDNEIGAPTFDDETKKQWHSWLTHKYGNVADLNRRWTTTYWSQTYDSFDQVPFHSREENPALLLDYKHFTSDMWVDYLDAQVKAIRPLADRRQWITTNTMGWFSAFDHYAAHRNLDIAAWDDYVPDGHLDPARNGALHDLVRGYKQRNFWVMETGPSFVNWAPVNVALPPGVVREMAWQAVGHGADAVLYWQWRSALNGQEQYHGVLVGADGKPVPIYDEVQKTAAEFARASAALAGTSPHARVAVLQSYDAHWAIDFQKHTNLFDYTAAVMDVYRAVSPLTQGVDVIAPEADLSSYAVVFAPALNVVGESLAQHLLAYVQGGGHLVLTARSAMKDADNGLWPQRQPGPLAAALGAHVEQFYALDPKSPPPHLQGALGEGTATVWGETLTIDAPDVEVLLRYDKTIEGPGGWLAGKPAAVEHHAGKGTITYVGALADSALLHSAIGKMLANGSVAPRLAGVPEGVELMERSAPGAPPVWILINHTAATQTVALPKPMANLLSSAAASSQVALPAHDVAVLR